MTQSARLALPMLAAAQMQKELTVNEGLARLDLLVMASVEAVGTNDPPQSPQVGECHVVGDSPTGAWAGQARALAGYVDGGWRFVAAVAGMRATVRASGLVAWFDGSAWQVGTVRASTLIVGGDAVVGTRQPAIADPVGGATADAEARASVGAILNALRAHGLIAS